MTTITQANTIYGQAAYGGKIHRTTVNGHAWCLSGNGQKPMRNVVVEIPASATRQEETDALRLAGIPPHALCSKCCSESKNLLEADLAAHRSAKFLANVTDGTLVDEQDEKITITNTTIGPMMQQHVRERLASSLCRLATSIPYCTDEQAREEFAMLDRSCSHTYLREVTGVASWKDLLNKAIIVRAAAENEAGA